MRRCSHALLVLADSDRLWKPLAEQMLRDKYSVKVSIRQGIESSDSRSSRCRKLLGEAVRDSKRCHISLEELVDFRWHFRWRSDSPMQFPPEFEPVYAKFDMTGHVGAVDHPMLHTQLPYSFIDPAPSLLRKGNYLVEDPDPPPCDFSTIRLSGRPPMRVYRHPGNWGFILAHHLAMIANYTLPAMGDDPFIERLPCYYHPMMINVGSGPT